MTPALPDPIRAFFDGNRSFDVDAMLATFADDAVVRDERREHRGTTAIRAWIDDAVVGNRAANTPLSIDSHGGRHRVETEVRGDFKGSPIRLAFAFEVRNGRIAALDIS